MRNLLNTLICILLTSPLAAFDITLEGVEFGKLQMATSQTSWSSDSQSLSEAITLNDGDVLQVVRYADSGYINDSDGNIMVNSNIYVTSGNIESALGHNRIDSNSYSFVVGPATIRVGYKFSSNGHGPFTHWRSVFAEMDYAILRAGASTQSSYVTIPANSSGNFEVKLQTSSDLQTWSPTTPGIFPYGDNAKFFRLVVE